MDSSWDVSAFFSRALYSRVVLHAQADAKDTAYFENNKLRTTSSTALTRTR